jgi:chromosome partitioning protein
MARVHAISNQKGGVGKTTTTVNLAAALGSLGRRVLVVDLDPQGNASSALGVDRAVVTGGVYDVLAGDPASTWIVPTSAPGVSVLPATRGLAGAEVELVDTPQREHRLRAGLAVERPSWDEVLIDCPPSLGLLTLNGLVAADDVLIPLQTEYFAMEGLSDLVQTIAGVQRAFHPDLRRGGVVLTMADRRQRLSREVERQARALFAGEVFATVIPRNVRLGEAPSFQRSIFGYDGASIGAAAYMALARELLAKGEAR